ncbi:MAG: 4-hydroxy-tetrahydrodipicolinate reductase [Deltaproteobacteria bacterium]|nr:4-hydroxy-tetrahydrodipicolinate reductase [Deltaproteobacteria bacterium]
MTEANFNGQAVRVGVVGAAGRMGQHLCQLVDDAADMQLAARVVEAGQSGGVPLAAVDANSVDILIDFSTPHATGAVAEWVTAHRVAWVLGTTGLGAAEQAAVTGAARAVAVFQASNFSVGVALLTELAARAAAVLGLDADIEIVETHHHHKRDAPSGTALTLAKAVAQARGQDLAQVRRDGRSGLGDERPRGEIGMHAVRLADIVGEHEVVLGWPAERLRLCHDARDRKVFAHGAVRAARWLAGRRDQPGVYGMADLLGATATSKLPTDARAR